MKYAYDIGMKIKLKKKLDSADNINKGENKMEDLRNRLQSIEWDMGQGTFSKDKIPYYKKLLQEYEEMKLKLERI